MQTLHGQIELKITSPAPPPTRRSNEHLAFQLLATVGGGVAFGNAIEGHAGALAGGLLGAVLVTLSFLRKAPL
jgi:hypothetical protein